MKKVEHEQFHLHGSLTNGEIIITKQPIGPESWFVVTTAQRQQDESEAATFVYLSHHSNKTHMFLQKHKFIKGSKAKKAYGG